MKTNAAEYFSSLSPLKDSRSGSSVYESHVQNGRSGRCHCCPYGYHIDLDFVRYCDMLNQGSKNDSPTLRHLKKLKRARRRQTKSMEVLLGLSPGKENEAPDQNSQTRLEIIEEPNNKSDSLRRDFTTGSLARRSQSLRERTPPPPPPRRCRTPLMSPPPPDVINSASMNPALNSSSNVDANEALQEAVLDFEEMLENSRERGGHRPRSDTLPPTLPSLDLLHHTPPLRQDTPLSPKLSGNSLGRSQSLPRQLPDDSPSLSRHQHYANSNSSLSSLCSTPGQPAPPPSNTLGTYATLGNYPHYPGSYMQPPALNNGFGPMGNLGMIQQSIRDQMATSLNRLKELEDEVKAIPKLQIKLNILKEEKRLLVHQLKSVRKGEDPALLLPPSLDSDISEDELEGRLSSLRSRGHRRRSESPMRVNLEEFRSYRRARRGSVSEGSECGSVADETPSLYIKETLDTTETTRLGYDTLERKRSQEQTTPVPPRKSVRDASTNCRVLTRDIGISHVGARTRSVGLTTDRIEPDKRKEIKAKPCMQCYERNRKTYESKSTEVIAEKSSEKQRRLSLSSVSLESIEPDKNERESPEREGNSKTSFLQKLGRKSAIISRLSEPQLCPPVLTFDNSTNTDPVRTRDQKNSTSLAIEDVFSRVELNAQLTDAKKKWEVEKEAKIQTIRGDLFSKNDVTTQLAEAKSKWETDKVVEIRKITEELISKEELNLQLAEVKEMCKAEKESEIQVILKDFISREDLRHQLSEAKIKWEVEKEEEMRDQTADLISKTDLNVRLDGAKQRWQEEKEQEIRVITADLISLTDLDAQLDGAKQRWQEEKEQEIRVITADLIPKVDLTLQLSEAKRKWEEEKEMLVQRHKRQLTEVHKPLTLDTGVQVTPVDPSQAKTKFVPLMTSVGVTAKPANIDVGVGVGRITDILCEKCANVKTRSIGSGDALTTDLLCDRCTSMKTKSIGVGEYKLSDIQCEKCSVPTRSIGSSNDRITDRLCEKCDNVRTRSVSTVTDKIPDQTKPKRTTSAQTSGPDLRTTGVNTQPISLKKDELNLDTSATPSPALTPEVERRPFGSSGVRVCDKCHETIHSVAKDIVNTSGTNSATNLPPIPPQNSKIPRLVDFSRGPDVARQDVVKSLSNLSVDNKPNILSMSLGSSGSETQLSSMSSSFTDSKASTVMNRSLTRSDLSASKPAKQDPIATSLPQPQQKPTPVTIASTKIPQTENKQTTSLTEKKDVTSASSSAAATTTAAATLSTKIAETSTKTAETSTKTAETSTKASSTATKTAETSTKTSSTATKTAETSSTSSSSQQGKRVPYNRQNTYTKFSEGLVNLGFDENADAEGKKKQVEEKAKASKGLFKITEKNNNTSKIVEAEETKKEDSSRKTIGSEPDIPSGKEPASLTSSMVAPASLTSSMVASEDEGDNESLMAESISSVLEAHGGGPASTYHSTSSLFTTTSEKSRKKASPSREMRAALKVLNDSIGKPVRSGQQLTNAVNIVQKEWFKNSSGTEACPHAVEDYMDVFEDYSKPLLLRVVNLSDVNGNTAMHYAVSHGNFDVVSILLDSKVCNVNQQNKAGYTAIMLVSLAQIRSDTHASVVQRLFQLGDVNIKASQHGQTALMLAVSHGRLDTVRLLVMAGAEINIQDEDGSTALMCAAEHGHLAIVRFLLGQPDTEPSLMDNDGSTALTIAVEAGHKDVGVLLYKHMNLSRGSSPYSSVRIKRSRTPTMSRSSITPPPRSSAPSSPGRSRKSSAPHSPGRSRQSSASLSNLMI